MVGGQPDDSSGRLGAGRGRFVRDLAPQGQSFGVAVGRLTSAFAAGFFKGIQIYGANNGSRDSGSTGFATRRRVGAGGGFDGKRQVHIQQRGPNAGGFARSREGRLQAA